MDKVKVSSSRKRVEVPIPSIDGGIAVLFRSLSLDESIALQSLTPESQEESLKSNFEILKKCFVEWNLQDDENVDIPFELDIVRKTITQVDLFALLQAVTGVQIISDDGSRILSKEEIEKKVLSA